MTKRLPAIPTTYKGIKFRSKLEAKYAKAFDGLGIPWTYEDVNYQFDDGTCYSPDFYLPDSKQYFEVKGLMEKDDVHKIKLLMDESVVVVGDASGDTWMNDPNKLYEGSDWRKDAYIIKNRLNGLNVRRAHLLKCPRCGLVSFMVDQPPVEYDIYDEHIVDVYANCPECTKGFTHPDKLNLFDLVSWDKVRL